MGSALQIIQLLVTLGPLLVELVKLAKSLGVSLKELIDSLKPAKGASEGQKIDADLVIQKTMLLAMREKMKEKGLCAPDNVVNLAALLANELDKGRATKVMEECGEGPIQADEGRFD